MMILVNDNREDKLPTGSRRAEVVTLVKRNTKTVDVKLSTGEIVTRRLRDVVEW